MTLNLSSIDKSWSLFLDRDGVINKKLPGDYVKSWEEFEFLDKVKESLAYFTEVFGWRFIVTNQQGIGKGIMTETQLEKLHDRMTEEMGYAGGRINKIYHSPYRAEERSVFRKPDIGMARKAKIDFPDIDFGKSIIVGDSASDMQFGFNAGMYTVLLSTQEELIDEMKQQVDLIFPDLKTFAGHLKTQIESAN